MAGEERLKAINELKKEGHNVAIGEVLGVDESTVREDLNSGNPEKGKKKSRKKKVASNDTSGNPEPAPIDAVAARKSAASIKLTVMTKAIDAPVMRAPVQVASAFCTFLPVMTKAPALTAPPITH